MGAKTPKRTRAAVACVLVDGHPAVLEAVVELLESEGIAVVGRARRGAEAIPLARSVDAVVVTDRSLPDMSGLEVAEEILRTEPGRAIVLYTATITPAGVTKALGLGVRGVVSKDSLATELVPAIRAAAAGGSYVDPRLVP